jgi:hypothetical protein
MRSLPKRVKKGEEEKASSLGRKLAGARISLSQKEQELGEAQAEIKKLTEMMGPELSSTKKEAEELEEIVSALVIDIF